MPKQTVLVTGATGFTGAHAIKKLKQDYHVIGVSRRANPNMLTVDLGDQVAVNEMMAKTTPDMILHLAGQNHVQQSWKEPVSTFETNVLATLYLLEAARKNVPNCRIVVVGSALQAEKAYPHPYSFSKSLQANLAKAWGDLYGMQIILAVPCNLVGPGPSTGVCSAIARQLINEKNRDKEIQLSNAFATRDYLDVRDAVRAYQMLLEYGEVGIAYEIGSGYYRTLEEVIAEFQKLTPYTIHATFLERKKEQASLNSSIKMNKLGWNPTISFEKSLRDMMEFAQKS
ncbi:NAD-dependent epimerase/dehydratase family protein [Guptibacillus hwajinpoensis]|uniref:NAD-dependent epimerase/dehydratase family protein n=1 Tax=Guptibacillus hwajinpoensis TaxID=208199 RepID=UPI001CFD1F2A|nr:NAD-dependent epimerase/dehydratase family protein [Pseudalkalibacillus hwajinpoensis]WLR59551.1 GDP-mannose 4,6-dehydratase [Pseudalkalibacillus hwajinpoensis]